MRKSLKARLLSEHLEGRTPSRVVREDPALREMEELARLLERVSLLRAEPDAAAGERMKARVMAVHREMMEGRRVRRKDPARPPRLVEPQRLSLAALATAAVIVVVLVAGALLLATPGRVTVPPALGLKEGEAWVLATGPLEVSRRGRRWREAGTPLKLEEGYSIRVPEGVRAEVSLENGSLFRLEGGSEARLDTVGERENKVELVTGRAYFRVWKGTEFTALGGDLEIEALGTVFDLDLTGDTPRVIVLEGEVESRSRMGRFAAAKLVQGRMLCPPPGPEGGIPATQEEAPEDLLRQDWLLWNRDLDAARGWKVDLLSGLDPLPFARETLALLGTAAGGVEPAVPGEEEGGEGQEEAAPSVALKAVLLEEGVSLTWELEGEGVDEFTVLRSAEGDPSYPRDVQARLPGAERRFVDFTVEAGMTYSYRLAFKWKEKVLYSNAVKVEIPAAPASMVLRAGTVDDGSGRPLVELAWHVEGDPGADTYVLVRAEMGVEPTFPTSTGMTEVRFAPAGPDYVFYDRNVFTGYEYSYRVYAVKEGRAVLQSNLVRVTVTTQPVVTPGGEA